MVISLLAGITLLLTAVAAQRSRTQETSLQATDDLLFRVVAQLRELRSIQQQIERLTVIQETAEAVIEGGTSVVRAVHKGITDIPFSILESIPVTREPTRMVRGVHDLTSDVVYSSISAVNKLVGGTLRAGIKSGATAGKPEEKQKKGKS